MFVPALHCAFKEEPNMENERRKKREILR